MIAIIDYGMGNLGSIQNMLSRIGADSVITSDPETIRNANKLILPGVGAFDRAMKNLAELGLVNLLNEQVLEKKMPILGICLGQQLLTRGSEEGSLPGFGWIDAEARKFRFEDSSKRKIPHMGWNTIEVVNSSPILDDRYSNSRFYFVHSYHVQCDREENVLARTRYGVTFHSAIINGHIMGIQFHPEKSHKFGYRLLSNYAAWSPHGDAETGEPKRHELFARTDVNPVEQPRDDRPVPENGELPVRVIPTLLLKGEGLVKTVRFKDPKYVGDPRNAVKIFNEKEVDELAIIDILATVEHREPRWDLLHEIISEAFMPIAYGGGIRTIEQARKILGMGAEKVLLNTAAVETPELVREASELFGAQSVVGFIDVKKNLFGKYTARIRRGDKKVRMDPVELARRLESLGAGELVVQSIDQEGTQKGYDVDLIRAVSDAVSIPVIASGGAGRLEDFRHVVREGGASAVAAGSFFVFQGRHRAVLISYPDAATLRGVFADGVS